MSRNRSANFIAHIPHSEVFALKVLRLAFAKKGITIKWYKNKYNYTVYFRQMAKSKVRRITIDLDTPAMDFVESQFTPEQVERTAA